MSVFSRWNRLISALVIFALVKCSRDSFFSPCYFIILKGIHFANIAALLRSHMKYSSSVIFPRRRFVRVASLHLCSTSSVYPLMPTLYCRCLATRSNSTFGYASFSLKQRYSLVVSDNASFSPFKIAQYLVRSALSSPNDSIGHFFIVFFLKCPHIPLPLPITVPSPSQLPSQLISAFPLSVSSFLLYLLRWHRFPLSLSFWNGSC